jgi:hypothetical protein
MSIKDLRTAKTQDDVVVGIGATVFVAHSSQDTLKYNYIVRGTVVAISPSGAIATDYKISRYRAAKEAKERPDYSADGVVCSTHAAAKKHILDSVNRRLNDAADALTKAQAIYAHVIALTNPTTETGTHDHRCICENCAP